jgi:ribosomal protein S3
MGQKVNPIAVRLKFNRFSDYNWFSDYYYSTLFFQDINLQHYLNIVKQPNSNKLGFRVGKCIIHRFPKRSFIHLFCLSDQRNDSLSCALPGISLNFQTMNEKKNHQENYRNFVSNNLENQITDPKKMLTTEVLQIEGPEGVRDETEFFVPSKRFLLKSSQTSSNKKLESSSNTNKYFDSSIFWLNCPIQQKKRALINLFRGAERTLGPVRVKFLSSKGKNGMEQRLSLRDLTTFSALNDSSKEKVKTEDFFLEQKKKDCFDHENPIKIVSENKKYWNKRYNFQFSLSNFQSVSNLTTFENKSIRRGSEGVTNLFFNFYTMYYYFSQKMNISNVDIFKTRDSIKFISAAKPDENTPSASSPQKKGVKRGSQLNQSIKQQIKRRTESDSKTSVLGSEFNREERTLQSPNLNKITRSSLSTLHALSNIRNVLSVTTNTSVSFRPLKVHSIFHSANFVAQEIVCKLEQKKSFRLICRLIFQQVTFHPSIKGIRITCSGRINGAEIAKTECRKFGETSLHVFSDKIDYAQAIASTPYGVLGVKVWISFI